MSVENAHDLCTTCGHHRVFHQIGRGQGVPVGVAFCNDRHAELCDCNGFTGSTPVPPSFERTHWQSTVEPSLVIDLRKIAVVRREYDNHPDLTAFTEAGFEIVIPASDVESFMTAWRTCP